MTPSLCLLLGYFPCPRRAPDALWPIGWWERHVVHETVWKHPLSRWVCHLWDEASWINSGVEQSRVGQPSRTTAINHDHPVWDKPVNCYHWSSRYSTDPVDTTQTTQLIAWLITNWQYCLATRYCCFLIPIFLLLGMADEVGLRSPAVMARDYSNPSGLAYASDSLVRHSRNSID